MCREVRDQWCHTAGTYRAESKLIPTREDSQHSVPQHNLQQPKWPDGIRVSGLQTRSGVSIPQIILNLKFQSIFEAFIYHSRVRVQVQHRTNRPKVLKTKLWESGCSSLSLRLLWTPFILVINEYQERVSGPQWALRVCISPLGLWWWKVRHHSVTCKAPLEGCRD